jgi:hypothetical protein
MILFSSNDLVKQAIAELQDDVLCRCHPAYKDRGLHDPDCGCDSAEAVQVVVDRIEQLAKHALRADAINEELEVKLQAALDIMVEVDDWVESLGIYTFDHEEPVTVFKKLRGFLRQERGEG